MKTLVSCRSVRSGSRDERLIPLDPMGIARGMIGGVRHSAAHTRGHRSELCMGGSSRLTDSGVVGLFRHSESRPWPPTCLCMPLCTGGRHPHKPGSARDHSHGYDSGLRRSDRLRDRLEPNSGSSPAPITLPVRESVPSHRRCLHSRGLREYSQQGTIRRPLQGRRPHRHYTLGCMRSRHRCTLRGFRY